MVLTEPHDAHEFINLGIATGGMKGTDPLSLSGISPLQFHWAIGTSIGPQKRPVGSW